MTVVSSKEFVSNHDRYFDLAMKELLYIRNGRNVFQVSLANGKITGHKKPDDDFKQAITMEEFRKRTHDIIYKFFENK